MNKIFLFFSLIVFVKCGSTEEDGPKRNSLGILKEAPFIHIELDVKPVSSDSIMVKTTITNDQDKELAIYKPYIPSDTSRLWLFSVLEKNTYDLLKFTGKRDSEKYVRYYDGQSSGFVIPRMDTSNFTFLQPGERLVVESNIAHLYQFEKFLKRGQREFKMLYLNKWPYVVNGKQVTEVDSTDQEVKPVYLVASVPEKDDPDSMRVYFRVP